VSLPLSGLRVLDLSRLLPGGFCSLLLADFGAEVLKVEDTGMGDYIRLSPPYYEGAHESARSALFLALNRNKRSIRLDLKTERGREALLALVRDYDVVPRDQAQQCLLAHLALEIEADRALATVEREVKSRARAQLLLLVGAVIGRGPADVVAHAGVLDLEHLGAEIGKEQRAEATGQESGQVENLDVA